MYATVVAKSGSECTMTWPTVVCFHEAVFAKCHNRKSRPYGHQRERTSKGYGRTSPTKVKLDLLGMFEDSVWYNWIKGVWLNWIQLARRPTISVLREDIKNMGDLMCLIVYNAMNCKVGCGRGPWPKFGHSHRVRIASGPVAPKFTFSFSFF